MTDTAPELDESTTDLRQVALDVAARHNVGADAATVVAAAREYYGFLTEDWVTTDTTAAPDAPTT